MFNSQVKVKKYQKYFILALILPKKQIVRVPGRNDKIRKIKAHYYTETVPFFLWFSGRIEAKKILLIFPDLYVKWV